MMNIVRSKCFIDLPRLIGGEAGSSSSQGALFEVERAESVPNISDAPMMEESEKVCRFSRSFSSPALFSSMMEGNMLHAKLRRFEQEIQDMAFDWENEKLIDRVERERAKIREIAERMDPSDPVVKEVYQYFEQHLVMALVKAEREECLFDLYVRPLDQETFSDCLISCYEKKQVLEEKLIRFSQIEIEKAKDVAAFRNENLFLRLWRYHVNKKCRAIFTLAASRVLDISRRDKIEALYVNKRTLQLFFNSKQFFRFNWNVEEMLLGLMEEACKQLKSPLSERYQDLRKKFRKDARSIIGDSIFLRGLIPHLRMAEARSDTERKILLLMVRIIQKGCNGASFEKKDGDIFYANRYVDQYRLWYNNFLEKNITS